MALMTDDCVFEATGPAPDGVRARGRRRPCARSGWSSSARPATPAFTEEESFVAGDRGVLRWRFELDGRRRRARARARRRRAALPGRPGRREALLRQGLTARARPRPAAAAPSGPACRSPPTTSRSASQPGCSRPVRRPHTVGRPARGRGQRGRRRLHGGELEDRLSVGTVRLARHDPGVGPGDQPDPGRGHPRDQAQPGLVQRLGRDTEPRIRASIGGGAFARPRR